VHAWLRRQSADALVAIVAVTAAIPGSLPLVASDLALDVAEATLRSEHAEEIPLPPPAPVATTHFEPPALNLARLDQFVLHLENLASDEPLAQLVDARSFDEASYRLSLLPLIGERGALNEDDPAARLAALLLEVEIGTAIEEVPTSEVERVSAGRVHVRRDHNG
jgi:hypothetical protein